MWALSGFFLVSGILFWAGMCVIVLRLAATREKERPNDGRPHLKVVEKADNGAA